MSIYLEPEPEPARIVITDIGPARVLAFHESLTGPMYYVELVDGGLRFYVYVSWCREHHEC